MIKLDSKHKKIVIVADPHNDINKIDNIIKREDADINICLGDWYDSYMIVRLIMRRRPSI
jgi:predicted phosphodiesterase